MLSQGEFPQFFEAVWGYPPFAWQVRLLDRVRSETGWPSTLDLPTGGGKTAALDVAVFALALDAFVPAEDRRQSRRVVLVVDRRVVVDQAYARAVRLAEALRDAQDGVVAEVASALRALQDDPDALPLWPAILRGGMPRESDWAQAPHQPVVLVSTVDQVGSRLLFRGYGVSDVMRPIHAGLLGRDTLYLLDEVHLSRPFEETLAAVARFSRAERNAAMLPRPLMAVRMSATVADRPGDAFALSAVDREHEVLLRRLGASKRAHLGEVKSPRDGEKARDAMARACVREVTRLAAGHPRAVVAIVNRIDTARRVAAHARSALDATWDVKLMTGRMRPLDRDDLQAALLDRIRAGRQRTDERILVVSTQAIEAGADLDFDALVTECASLDALRQRFGRLDRFGDLGNTEAVILACSSDVDDKASADPIYGFALRDTWRWLHQHGVRDSDGDAPVVDFGIDALDQLLAKTDQAALAALLAPRRVAPVLLLSHLERWAQTSPVPSADPDVAAFLHGTEPGSPDVSIVWRADITEKMLAGDGALVREILAAIPPSSLEALSIPLWTARSWLEAVAARRAGNAPPPIPGVADVEGAAEATEQEATEVAPAILWRGDDTEIARTPKDIRPGATLVVPSTYGGLRPEHNCWDPAADQPVRDRGDEAHLLHRGRPVLRWTDAVVADWAGADVKGPHLHQEDLAERGADAEREAFTAWRAALVDQPNIPPWARAALSARDRPRFLRLDEGNHHWRATFHPKPLPPGELRALFAVPAFSHAWAASDATTEGDGGSFIGVEGGVSLLDHLAGVESFARRFAMALALPTATIDDIAFAGRLHDLGKADPRFQLLLHGGDVIAEAMATTLLAKSSVSLRDRRARARARERSGYPRGARHELMSVALVEQSNLSARAADWELVLHLVASHHGYCRPFAPPAVDPEPVEVVAEIDEIALAASSDHQLVRVDSGVADRFWALVDRYGFWGLAWLEAILRLADHRESEEEEQHV